MESKAKPSTNNPVTGRHRNPYKASGIVMSRDMFFGRETELGSIRSYLSSMMSVSIVGLRRIGKSSLLWQFVHSSNDIPHPRKKRYVRIYVDLHEPSYSESPKSFWTAVLKDLFTEMKKSAPAHPIDWHTFSAEIGQLYERGICPILCLDEFEQVAQREEFDIDFFAGMRSLINVGKLAIVTASQRLLIGLIPEARGSPFFNLLTPIKLGLLNPEAARALIERPSRNTKVTFTDLEIQMLLRLAGRHPFYLQIACRLLWDIKEQNVPLDTHKLRDSFIDKAEQSFQHLWENLGTEERQVCERLARGRLEEGRAEGPVLKDLESKGVVVKEELDGGWQLFSQAFASLIREGRWEIKEAPKRVIVGERGDRPPLQTEQTDKTPVSRGQKVFRAAVSLLAGLGTLFIALTVFTGQFGFTLAAALVGFVLILLLFVFPD
jgi:hypothetical protein